MAFNNEIYDPAYDDSEIFYDEDIAYHRALETEEIDWEEMAYEINDPKHPSHYDTFADIADREDIPF